MPYQFLAQPQTALPLIDVLRELAPFAAGFGVLMSAFGYVVRQVFEIKKLRAGNEAIQTKAAADDEKAENEQFTSLINVIREQTNVYGAELVNMRREYAQHGSEVLAVMKDNVSQTKALRQDVKEWPSAVASGVSNLTDAVTDHDAAVQGKLVNLETAVRELKKRMDITEANAVILNTIKVMLESREADSAKIATMHQIISEYDPRPPKPPDSKPSAPSKTQLAIADGGAHDTVKPDSESEAAA